MFNFFLTDLCFLLHRDGECAFFWTTLISLGRRICTLLTMVNFPGVGHLNWKDDQSSNPPPLPGLPPQRLNIDRCIMFLLGFDFLSALTENRFCFFFIDFFFFDPWRYSCVYTLIANSSRPIKTRSLLRPLCTKWCFDVGIRRATACPPA